MNVSRGAHNAISSWASTGRSPAVRLPNFDSAAPYLRKLPAIQWYSPEPVRFSTASPQFRRCSFAPPSPDEPISTHHHHRHRLRGVCGRDNGHLDVDADVRVHHIVDRADELLRNHRTSARVEALR